MPVPWILLSVLLVVASVLVLALPAFGLYRRVRALLRATGHAGEVVGAAAERLAAAQAAGPLGAARSGDTG